MAAPHRQPVRVSVLGSVRAWRGSEPVELGGPRQRSLLARLVLAQGHVVSVDRLIDDLWHGEPPPKALSALQAYVSHLRRVLEPDRPKRAPAGVIVSAAPGYRLHVPTDSVDAWWFDEQVRAGQSESDPRRRAELLGAALRGWAGEPYAEVSDAAWAIPEIARLTELRIAAIELRASAELALGHDNAVVGELEPVVRDHPTREGAAAILATALYRLGRQAAALDVLRSTRIHLSDELGLEPGRALRDLERDILSHAPHLDSGQSTTVAAPAVLPSPPSVIEPEVPHGRSRELSAIDDAAREACSGGCRLVWVGGEAGAGKTTVTNAAATRLRAAGWTVAAGRCPEVDGAPPGWAWTEVLRQFSGSFAAAEPRHLRALAPLLHEAESGAADVQSTFWTAHAVADVIGRSATSQPVAVVLDDLHRTDGLTLELLRLVSHELQDRPVLVIATYRPSESGGELASARAALAVRTVTHLSIGGLDRVATAALAADCGLSDLTEEGKRALHDRTGGNPLFVRELSRLMISEGVGAARVAVPTGVGDVLRRRLVRLPGATVTALRQAAVLGREVDIDVLADLAHRDPDDVLDALEPAILVGLLDEPAPGLVRFAHALVRDTLYEDTSLLRRARLHATALELLSRSPRAADPAALAYHAVAAATPASAAAAAELAMAAGRDADRVGAPVEAARQWQAAVRMLALAGRAETGPPDVERTVDAYCGWVAAAAGVGDVVAARDALKQALSVAGQSDELTARLLTAWNAPLIWRVRISDAPDADIVGPLQRVLAGELPPDVRARLLTSLFAELEGADQPAALAASAEALTLARELYVRDPHTYGRVLCAALNARAYAALGPDLAREREQLTGEFLTVAEAVAAVDYQAVAHWLAFLSAAGRSDLVAAHQHVDLAVARAGTGQLASLLTVLDVFNAQLTVLAGRTDEGERRYAAAARELAEQGTANGAQMALVGRFTAGLARGDLSALADDLLAVHTYVSTAIADAVVLALLSAGRQDDARRIWATREPVERSYYWLAMTTLRAHAAVALGDAGAAQQCAEELQPYSGRIAGLDNGSLLAGPVDDALAAVAQLVGRADEAQHYRAAAIALRSALATEAARIIDGISG
ncbi:BTAD domain-containing putative transcriptional regulator [Mycolicibacterium vinylchloridicum]|uniref:BTAD domain-containing putative transcriptional regulator n=1 Tax=Mycolicibacterium vinylchloridicum TaxID=2736928 RepID=UPI0015C6DBD9|nr:BTAD domain-containing putative transcriptional regulator [Mycolicibacterium vinylchloridicum]